MKQNRVFYSPPQFHQKFPFGLFVVMVGQYSFSTHLAGGGVPSFVGNSDNRVTYDPGKTSWSQYRLCGYSGNSATQRQAYEVATYSLCWDYWKSSKPQENQTFKCFFLKISLLYLWCTLEKVAQNNVLFLCFKTCSGSNGSLLEIDEVILAKNMFFRDFSPLACVVSHNLEILTLVTKHSMLHPPCTCQTF